MRLAFLAGLPLALALACTAFSTGSADTAATDAGAVEAAPGDAGAGPCSATSVYCNDFEGERSLDDLQRLTGFDGEALLVPGSGPSGGQSVQTMLEASSDIAAFYVTAAAGLTFEADLRVMGGGNSFPVFVLGINDPTTGNSAWLALDQGQHLYIDVGGPNGQLDHSTAYPDALFSAWIHVVMQGSKFTVGPVGSDGDTKSVTLPTFASTVEYVFGATTGGPVNGFSQVDVDWVRLTQ